ncbi:MAG TPA: 3'-5' exonuclease, partial [Phycisphaerae bacterium]|nr:3'-5' exonuclease [Phycisphaerae bacterium]
NFRSGGDVIDWVNEIFGVGSEIFFGSNATDMQAEAESMHLGRDDTEIGPPADINGVYSLTIDQPGNVTEAAVEEESGKIAAFIRDAIDTGKTIVDFRRDGAAYTRAVKAGDFMIITHNKNHMAVYARALNERNLPAQVTGGGELNGTPEIKWLLDCLRAVSRPIDSVALVASLRSELWGFSDADLLTYKRAGGVFNYRTALPDSLPQKVREKFSAAFASMKIFSHWLDGEYPPVVVVEKMLTELGLLMRGAARQGGMGNVGAMCRLLELLRNRQRDNCSAAELVNMLQDIVDGAVKFDTIPPRPLTESPVRVMNLHKAKGLQAQIVFLACPRGRRKHDVTSHIHRGEDGVKGFMAFFRETAFGQAAIAFPSGWSDAGGWNDIEGGFLEAEQVRLLYVAATRAGRALVVSTHPKSLTVNPWNPFREMLKKELPLPKISEQADIIQKTAASENLCDINVASLETQIAAKKAILRQPTFTLHAAKSLAMNQSADNDNIANFFGESDSMGQNWGSAVHRLLELYMRNDGIDLNVAAAEAANQYELDSSIVTELADTVRSVAHSELWSRAKTAEKCLVEVPFEICKPADGQPMIISGVIDMAFKTPAGWVIADYKTDATDSGNAKAVAEHYRPQMKLYADVWQDITGLPVCETGIYLVAIDRYVTL